MGQLWDFFKQMDKLPLNVPLYFNIGMFLSNCWYTSVCGLVVLKKLPMSSVVELPANSRIFLQILFLSLFHLPSQTVHRLCKRTVAAITTDDDMSAFVDQLTTTIHDLFNYSEYR